MLRLWDTIDGNGLHDNPPMEFITATNGNVPLKSWIANILYKDIHVYTLRHLLSIPAAWRQTIKAINKTKYTWQEH